MTLRRCLSFAFLALLLAAPITAPAQFAVYAMGSGGFASSLHTGAADSPGFHTWGGTFGVYDDVVSLGPVKLGADARYFQETRSTSNGFDNKLHGGSVGLRLALKLPLVPFKPYLQGEAGAVGTNYGAQPDDVTSILWQIQGGLDFTVFPHLDLRAEYGGGQIDAYSGDGKQTLQKAGIGAVVRF